MMAAEATNYRGATDGLWGTATAAFLDTMAGGAGVANLRILEGCEFVAGWTMSADTPRMTNPWHHDITGSM